MSNSPPVPSQYPSAARKTLARPSPTSTHLPAAALSANRRLSGLKRLSSSSYRAQSISTSRNATASTSADTAHKVSNARNVTVQSSRMPRLLPKPRFANQQSPRAKLGPAKQASTMVLGCEACAGRETLTRRSGREVCTNRKPSRTELALSLMHQQRKPRPRMAQAAPSRTPPSASNSLAQRRKGAFALPQKPPHFPTS